MKKYFSKLVNISLFTFLVLGNLSFASAQNADGICMYANYQNGTVAPESFAGLSQDETKRAEEIAEHQKKYQERQDKLREDSELAGIAYENYTVVIAEEPLGPGDGEFSANCARKIECVKGNFNSAAPEKTIESCYSQYTSISGCAPSETVTCEIVQIYVAKVGTALLYGYVGQIYRYVAFLGGLIAVFVIIVAGIMWTSAGGNSESISNAKAMIARCLVGLAVLFLSALILYTINPNFFTIS